MNSGDRNMCITAAIVMLVVLFCFSRKEGMTESPTSISLGQGTLKLTLGGAPTKPKAPKAPSKSDQAKAAAGVLMVDEKGNPVSTVNSQGQFVRSSLPGSTPGAAGTIGTGLMNQGGGVTYVLHSRPANTTYNYIHFTFQTREYHENENILRPKTQQTTQSLISVCSEQ